MSAIKLTSLHLFAVFWHVVWSDWTQEFYVIITVVLGHLLSTGFMWTLKHKNTKSAHQTHKKVTHLTHFQQSFIHISPSFCRGHSWATSCVSCGFCGASWDAPDRSNSSQHHLKWKPNTTGGIIGQFCLLKTATTRQSNRTVERKTLFCAFDIA